MATTIPPTSAGLTEINGHTFITGTCSNSMANTGICKGTYFDKPGHRTGASRSCNQSGQSCVGQQGEGCNISLDYKTVLCPTAQAQALQPPQPPPPQQRGQQQGYAQQGGQQGYAGYTGQAGRQGYPQQYYTRQQYNGQRYYYNGN
ncbi:hypothetical protein B9Z65_8367 [Elsinoe australis]|uniref:Uncharacterized protein n=1 Tax=Elsinoe australis TaxID=40998 RepID=A0A2P7YDK1_9PEZI|nr:hypothetical protein B9Z65_8367 [Elsinoe australis]